MELKDFWNCLFYEGQATCITDSPKGTDVTFVRENSTGTFFSINGLSTFDSMPVEQWHNEKRGRRADCNVTTFRNILIEMDKIPVEQQEQYVSEIKLPYSTAVYSGGKSIHYIISLETSLDGAKSYRSLVERVYRAVGREYVDLANKNPSRLSRVPGHLRTDTGKEQKLLAVNGRIPNSVLEEWLNSRGAKPLETSWEDVPRRKGPPKDISSLSGDTRNFLVNGTQQNWNISLFKAAADLCRNGWSVDEALTELNGITGTLDTNDIKTVRSAYRNEENQA